MVGRPVRIAIVLILAAVACAASAVTVLAADWKIRTQVFESDSTKPITTTTTYFCDGVYYDVLGEPAEATIVDRAAGRITLVDTNRRWQTEIKTDDLVRLAERFRAAAAESKTDDVLRFVAEGKFTTSFSAAANELVVDGSPLRYRVACENARDAENADACREFADWCARLNSVQPGRMPARARLMVNEELARRGLVAKNVELTLRGRGSEGDTKLRSEHVYTWRLSTDDLVHVARIKKMPAQCRSVSFAEYLGYEAAGRNSAKERR